MARGPIAIVMSCILRTKLFPTSRPPTSLLIILCESELSLTLSSCLSIEKREMQNFRVGKNSFTDIYHINMCLANPCDVPGITKLDVVEADLTKSFPCLKFHNLEGVG